MIDPRKWSPVIYSRKPCSYIWLLDQQHSYDRDAAKLWMLWPEASWICPSTRRTPTSYSLHHTSLDSLDMANEEPDMDVADEGPDVDEGLWALGLLESADLREKRERGNIIVFIARSIKMTGNPMSMEN